MRVWFACLGAALLACGGVAAKDDHDQDRARRAVEEGRMLPLRDIVGRAEAAFSGQVVEAELEGDDIDSPIYEIKLVTRDGTVMKLRYDARTGALLTNGRRDGRP